MAKTIINALPVGATLQKGKYRIQKVLGQGTFGITYLAKTRLTAQGTLGAVDVDVNVAIKEFFMSGCNGRNGTSVTYSGSDNLHDDYMRKFRQEAEHLSRFHHEGIVRVLDVFGENDTWYYAMEYIDGGSLDDYIRHCRRLPVDEALRFALQVGEALSYLHGRNALHLDLKPSNIMLRGDGQPVLIDFGLTKQYASDGRAETSTSIGLGTTGYAPMEQNNYHKGKTFAPTLDIYALGATLYKMLVGETPPAATDIYDEGFPEGVLTQAGIDSATIAVIRKAMEPRKSDRYQTADEMTAAIKRIKPGQTTSSNKGSVGSENEETITDDKKNGKASTEHESERVKTKIKTPRSSAGGKSPKEDGWITKKTALFLVVISLAMIIAVFALVGKCGNSLGNSEDSCDYDTIAVDRVTTGTINGHGYVDLGLSVKWATMNVGASKPEEYGDYYAWGETSTKTSYTSDNCATWNKSIGDIKGTSRDVAHVKWGGAWRMPTETEFQELIDNCTWEWITRNGVNGYKVTSKKSGYTNNSIFLPAAGWRYGTSLYDRGEYGLYWSSTPYESTTQRAYRLYFYSGYRYASWNNRYGGRTVRPVAE